jgi:hypothetical protein
MRSLAERAIRMCRTVRMNVRHLDCAAKEEKSREKRYEQNIYVRIARPYFADPSHNYFSLYLRVLKAPIPRPSITSTFRPPQIFSDQENRGKEIDFPICCGQFRWYRPDRQWRFLHGDGLLCVQNSVLP